MMTCLNHNYFEGGISYQKLGNIPLLMSLGRKFPVWSQVLVLLLKRKEGTKLSSHIKSTSPISGPTGLGKCNLTRRHLSKKEKRKTTTLIVTPSNVAVMQR